MSNYRAITVIAAVDIQGGTLCEYVENILEDDDTPVEVRPFVDGTVAGVAGNDAPAGSPVLLLKRGKIEGMQPPDDPQWERFTPPPGVPVWLDPDKYRLVGAELFRKKDENLDE